MDMSQHPATAADLISAHADAEAAEKRETDIAYLIIAAIIGAWAGSTAIFGLIGFIMFAVAMVPVIFVLMIKISLG